MINDFEDKETRFIDLGFEGLNKPGEGILIWPLGRSDYCSFSVINDEIEELN